MHLTQIHVKVQYGSQTKTHLDKTQPGQNPTVTNPTVTKPHHDKTQRGQNPAAHFGLS